ncbi:hypothetical protein PR202_ga05762 [Eleusine coracana subsp. coracana]|uniref:starch synthase n=1 Tax=Eleusine coracana subsp. coracana TaxID=191504 RepID=A0AAV5BVI5_ELECO|nr:hypothetical protein PR202_ga05762 [Eleusine coracana subsp. coracana]
MISAATRTGAQPPQKNTPGANHRNRVSIQRDVVADSVDEEQKLEEENGLTNIQLEDLVGMIQDTEKNILLLNQARLQALERADKFRKEKEVLQQKIDILQMKLSETAVQQKLLSEEESDMENSDSQLLMELDALKEENMLIKDDIKFLKTQLVEITETEESLLKLEKERALLDTSLRDLECGFIAAQSDMLKLGPLQHDAWWEKVENLEELLESTAKQVEHAAMVLERYHDFPDMVEKIEASLRTANVSKFCLYLVDLLQQRVKSVQERFKVCNDEMHSQIELYEHSIVEFHDTLSKIIKASEKQALEHYAEGMPSEFWSRISLLIDGWSLEKKISYNDADILREMAWKRDNRLREAYLSSRGMEEREMMDSFLKVALPGTSSGLHIVHIAAEMAPVAKVGGLADVISGLAKSLQKKGHLVEIILPKYDCMQHGQIHNLKVLDVKLQSYFEGHLFGNKIWTGTVEGLPVYFIEPQHPAKFFWRAQYYGEHDDFKRFSYFSRAALELLYQSGKKIDIIHCHDWQTGFVAPLYWDIYANLGFNSARICFTCHNFEYQGTAPPQDLAYCGLDVERLDRPDRMQDNSHGRINVVKGAVVYSNIVTTVSPTYAQEVRSEREFEGIADHFQNNNNIQLILKYDDALSHMIFAASDMFIVPSMFEPCGLTQMIAMRYGSVPIVRKTGGLNDSVFDFDDETIPMELRNGFTFVNADEQMAWLISWLSSNHPIRAGHKTSNSGTNVKSHGIVHGCSAFTKHDLPNANSQAAVPGPAAVLAAASQEQLVMTVERSMAHSLRLSSDKPN